MSTTNNNLAAGVHQKPADATAPPASPISVSSGSVTELSPILGGFARAPPPSIAVKSTIKSDAIMSSPSARGSGGAKDALREARERARALPLASPPRAPTAARIAPPTLPLPGWMPFASTVKSSSKLFEV